MCFDMQGKVHTCLLHLCIALQILLTFPTLMPAVSEVIFIQKILILHRYFFFFSSAAVESFLSLFPFSGVIKLLQGITFEKGIIH